LSKIGVLSTQSFFPVVAPNTLKICSQLLINQIEVFFTLSVEEWTNTTFRKKLKKQAEEEGGEIYLCDESEIYTENVYGKSYSPKGKTPVIKTTGSRLKMNVISSYLMMVL
jgi:hypothetical protein